MQGGVRPMLIITMKALRGKQTRAEVQKQMPRHQDCIYTRGVSSLLVLFFLKYKIPWKILFYCTSFYFFPLRSNSRPALLCSPEVWRLLLALPPFLGFLLACVGVDLVPHPAQDVGGGFGGHDERLDHGRRQLAQNSAHRPSHAALLVLPGGCAVDCQRSVCDPLEIGAWGGKSMKEETFVAITQVYLYIFYLFYDSVGFRHSLPQVHWLMRQSVVGEALYFLCVLLIRHWRHHVVGCLGSSLRRHGKKNVKRLGRQRSMMIFF